MEGGRGAPRVGARKPGEGEGAASDARGRVRAGRPRPGPSVRGPWQCAGPRRCGGLPGRSMRTRCGAAAASLCKMGSMPPAVLVPLRVRMVSTAGPALLPAKLPWRVLYVTMPGSTRARINCPEQWPIRAQANGRPAPQRRRAAGERAPRHPGPLRAAARPTSAMLTGEFQPASSCLIRYSPRPPQPAWPGRPRSRGGCCWRALAGSQAAASSSGCPRRR